MRIAYLHYVCGSDTALHHVGQFTDAARSLGYEVAVYGVNLAAAANGNGAGNGNGPSAPVTRDRVKRHLSRYLHEPKELLWNARYVRRELAILRDARPDVMLVRAHPLTVADVIAKKIAGIPLVLEVNAPSVESTTFYDEYAHVPYAAFATERFQLRRADRLVVVSSGLRDYLMAAHGLPASRFVVNHNGGDSDRFRPDVSGSGVRARYGLTDRVVVGFVGSFHPWHGAHHLKTIITRIADPTVRFLVVGLGEAANREFADWLAARGCADRVVACGRIPHDEVPQYVAAMDVALLPGGTFYGSPLKLFEYMASGRAVVSAGYPPVAEVAEDGKHALLFRPDDIDDAVAVIRRLVADPSLRARLGVNARERILANFTWKHNAERILDACRSVRPQPGPQ